MFLRAMLLLALTAIDMTNGFGFDIGGNNAIKWDKLVNWDPTNFCQRTSLVRTSANSELIMTNEPDERELAGYDETMKAYYGTEIDGTIKSYAKAEGQLYFSWKPNGFFDVVLNFLSYGKSLLSYEKVYLNVSLYGPYPIVKISPEIVYLLHKSELKADNETVKALFTAGNRTLNISTISMVTYENGGGWFANEAASINITKISKLEWQAAGRLTDNVAFEFTERRFRINGTYGYAEYETVDCGPKYAMKHSVDTPLADGRTARLSSGRSQIVVYHNRRTDLSIANVLKNGVKIQFDSQHVSLPKNGFSYNNARRTMLLTDDGANPELLEVVATKLSRSMRLEGPNQTLVLEFGNSGAQIACRDNLHFTITADGFSIQEESDILTFNRSEMTITIKGVFDVTHVDLLKRRASGRYQPEWKTSKSDIEDMWEIPMKYEPDYIEFADDFIHLTFLKFIIHYRVLTNEVSTNAGDAGWTAGGGFWARCNAGGFRASVDAAPSAEKELSETNGKESDKTAGKKLSETARKAGESFTWTASGRRVQATLTASGRLYARNDARQLTFSATEDKLVLRTYITKLVIA